MSYQSGISLTSPFDTNINTYSRMCVDKFRIFFGWLGARKARWSPSYWKAQERVLVYEKSKVHTSYRSDDNGDDHDDDHVTTIRWWWWGGGGYDIMIMMRDLCRIGDVKIDGVDHPVIELSLPVITILGYILFASYMDCFLF